MRLILILPILFSLQSCSGNDKNIHFEQKQLLITKICELPEDVNETSGILFYNSLLWTINDSDNEPKLFAIDTASGEVVRELTIVGATNVDWEAITQDDKFIYIADNGNNNRTREKYSIYLIDKDSITNKSKQLIQAYQKIDYFFTDKQLEAINLNSTNVDSEAILVEGDSLFVYIKDWLFNDFTACTFSLKEPEGEIHFRGSFPIGFAVTAVTKMDDNKIAVLGYRNYHSYLSILESNPQLMGEVTLIASYELVELKGYQTEGITYENGKFFISCERLLIPQSLFSIELL